MVDREGRDRVESKMHRIALLCVTISCFIRMAAFGATETTDWQSPFEAKVSPDGKWLAVSDRTAGMLLVVDPLKAKVVKEASGLNQPAGVVLGLNGQVLVSEYASQTVAEVDAANGQVVRRITVGHGPMGLAVAPKKNFLIVCNSNSNDISLVDIESAKEKARIPVVRQPSFVAVHSPRNEFVRVVRKLNLRTIWNWDI